MLDKKYCVFDDFNEDLDATVLKRKTRCDIVLLADIGLWNGREFAAVNVSEKEKSKDIYKLATRHLMKCDSNLYVYTDGHDVIAVESHHDGNNYYRYRQMTKKSQDEFEKVKEQMVNNFDSETLLNKFLELSKPLI